MHAATHALGFDSALVDISQVAAQQIPLCEPRGMVLMPQSLLRAGSSCVIFKLGWNSALVDISQSPAHQIALVRGPHSLH